MKKKKWITTAFLTSALILVISSPAHADKKVEVIKGIESDSSSAYCDYGM
ncbi:hypothetical protein [Psychrobacillus sp.]|nr:hypothetical protein [Psychrobacillus sp.]